ncbi:MAG: HNH endonuclease signature motif containing protein [Candidatus Gracilibacteria bacterium]|jgi:hypothetical protein
METPETVTATETALAVVAPPPKDLQLLSDSELYQLCQEYGSQARIWKRKFAGLLPEVLRRELYRRRGCGSIYEFAFKIGAMSSTSVDRIIKLDAQLEDKPTLKAQLLSGSQGWSKLEKVAYIATPDTEKEWAERVEKMSQVALSAYVQEYRKILFTETVNVSETTASGLSENKTKTVQVWGQMSFPVSPEVEKRLRLTKYQLEKEKKSALTFSEVLGSILTNETAQNTQNTPQIVIQLCPECQKRIALTAEKRPIPASVRRFLYHKYQGLCAFPNCFLPACSLHHLKRYAIERMHNTDNIVPVCKKHEALLHSGMIENEESPPHLWKLRIKPAATSPATAAKSRIDDSVMAHRREPEPIKYPLQSGP